MTRAARWEWAFASEAIARGDLLLLLDDEPAAEQPISAGDRIWLLPSWQRDRTAAVKRAWWPEISRASRTRPADGRIPVRCLCEIVRTYALDEATRTRIAPFHPWSAEGASTARRALLVRAGAHPAPWTIASPEGTAGYVELVDEPAEDGLLPALTAEAFGLHRAPLERRLEPADASRP